MDFYSTLILFWGIGILFSLATNIFWISLGRIMIGIGAIGSLGAYSFTFIINSNFPIWLGLISSICVGICCGGVAAITARKTLPDDFILITIAIVEIVRRLAFHFSKITGGAYGITLSSGSAYLFSDPLFLQISVGVVGLLLLATMNFWFKSLNGLEWRIVGSSRLGAETIGINALRIELIGGCFAGALASLAGISYMVGINYLHPNDLSIDISLIAVAAGMSIRVNKYFLQMSLVTLLLFISREILRLVNMAGTSRFGLFDCFLGIILIFLAFHLSHNDTH